MEEAGFTEIWSIHCPVLPKDDHNQDNRIQNWLFFVIENIVIDLGPGASCWKVGSYLPMPGGLQCNMHWFPPPVYQPSQYDPGC